MAISRMRRRVTLVNREDLENKFGRQTRNESQTFSKLLLTENDDLRGLGSQPVLIEDHNEDQLFQESVVGLVSSSNKKNRSRASPSQFSILSN